MSKPIWAYPYLGAEANFISFQQNKSLIELWREKKYLKTLRKHCALKYSWRGGSVIQISNLVKESRMIS